MTIRRKIRLAGMTGSAAAALAGFAGFVAWYLARRAGGAAGSFLEIGVPALQLAASILCLAMATIIIVVTSHATRRRNRGAQRAPVETKVESRPDTTLPDDSGELGELEEIDDGAMAPTPKPLHDASAFVAPDAELEELEVVETSDDLEELEVIDPGEEASDTTARGSAHREGDPNS